MNKIKVVICLESLELGGAERQAFYLASYLHRHAEFEVETIAFANQGSVANFLDNENIRWEILSIQLHPNLKSILKNCLKLLLVLRKKSPEVIVPFTYGPNLLCGLVWRFTGARACFWNQRDEGRRIRGSILEKFAIKYASKLISNSSEGSYFLEQKFGLDEENVKLVFNGVVEKKIIHSNEWWYSHLNIKPNTFVVSMVASLHPFKDHTTLIKAWKIFLQKVGDIPCVLLLAGRKYHSFYEHSKLVDELDLQDKVIFLGGVEDIGGLLAITDVGAFSSNYEGCPNAILEYMNAALPVVATDILGVRDALGEDYSYLVAPNSPKKFADKLYELYGNKKLRIDLGLRNKQYVEVNFSLEEMGNQYLSLIHQVINQ